MCNKVESSMGEFQSVGKFVWSISDYLRWSLVWNRLRKWVNLPSMTCKLFSNSIIQCGCCLYLVITGLPYVYARSTGSTGSNQFHFLMLQQFFRIILKKFHSFTPSGWKFDEMSHRKGVCRSVVNSIIVTVRIFSQLRRRRQNNKRY